jgi:hypothetical protein
MTPTMPHLHSGLTHSTDSMINGAPLENFSAGNDTSNAPWPDIGAILSVSRLRVLWPGASLGSAGTFRLSGAGLPSVAGCC